jgi:anti-sigma factor RsiW
MMSERLVKQLHAYHDGELTGLRRWWLERRIAANPRAQSELARLRELGAALRAQAEETPAPDLWSAIVMQLPAAVPAAEAARERDGFGFTLPRWAGAVVAAGAVALAVFVMPRGDAPPLQADVRGSAVQLLDTGRRPAVILQDDGEATIILLLPKQNLAAEGVSDVVG